MTAVRPRNVEYLLTLRADGGAEVTAANRTLWASDTDEEFAQEFAGREMLDENDLPELFDYLVDTGVLSDDEADDCEIDIEVLDADDTQEDVINVDSEDVH